MSETLHPALATLSQDGHDEIVKALTDWKEGGNPAPRIPTGNDMDVFMMNDSGDLIVASSIDFQEAPDEVA